MDKIRVIKNIRAILQAQGFGKNTLYLAKLIADYFLDQPPELHKEPKPTGEIERLNQTTDWNTNYTNLKDKINEIIKHLNNKPQLPSIPTTNMNSFQAVWAWNRKLLEVLE